MAFLFLLSCNKSQIRVNDVSVDILEVIGEKRYRLDSQTSLHTRYMRYQKFEGKKHLMLLNSAFNKIQVYDPDSGHMVWSLNFRSSQDNNIGREVTGFYISSEDSIYVFDKWSGLISRLNNRSEVLEQYNLAPNGVNTGYAFPVVSSFSPMLLIDSVFLVSGIIPGVWRNMNLIDEVMLKYDLERDSLTYGFRRPTDNKMFNWGDGLLNYVYYDVKDANGEILIGIANNSELNMTNLDMSESSNFETQSIYFDEVKPFSNDYNKNPDPYELEDYYFSNGRYWGIIHDSYRSLTYRLTQYPFDTDLVENGMRKMKSSIIVLNADFEKIGEQDIDTDEYDLSMIYVSEEGLNIASKKKFKENESFLVFDTFTLIPN